MDKIRNSISCIFTSLRDGITINKKLAAAYVFILFMTGCITALIWYLFMVPSETNLRPVGTPPAGSFVTLFHIAFFAMTIVSIACLLRLYWPLFGMMLFIYFSWSMYLASTAMSNDPNGVDRMGVFLIIFPTALITLAVPSLVFFVLCFLTQLPRPQSRGWGAFLREHQSIGKQGRFGVGPPQTRGRWRGE